MDLNELRLEIDEIDRQMVALFEKRMEISVKVAQYKLEKELPVLDSAREKEKLESISDTAGEDMKDYATELYKAILELSRKKQTEYIDSHSSQK